MTYAAFLISLADAQGRRGLMAQEFATAGLSVETIDAVDSRVVAREEMLRSCRNDGPWGYFQTKDMACTLSHARAWEAFLRSGAGIGFVFEDDVFLAPDIGHWATDLSWWPEDADLVKFERWRSDGLRVVLGAGSTHRGRDVRRLHSRHAGGAAYALTAGAAEQLLKARPYDVTLDALLFNPEASRVARGFKIYQVQPAMAEQGNEAWGEVGVGPPRTRPTGEVLLRQKLRRGWHEVWGGLRHLSGLASGQRRLEKIRFDRGSLPEQNSH